MRELLITSFIAIFLFSCGKMTEKTKRPVDVNSGPITSGGNDGIDVDASQVGAPSGGYTGKDIQGQTRTCVDQSANSICTAVFTPSDSFAMECKQRGDIAVMCGCHDWICVEKN